jgi:hypothetical protein
MHIIIEHCLIYIFIHIFLLCLRDSNLLIFDYPVLTVTIFQIYCHMISCVNCYTLIHYIL